MTGSRWTLALLLGGVAAAPAPPPRVTALPDPGFRLADSVSQQLSYVTDLAVDSDGTVYVADGRLTSVLQLEPSGAFRRSIGRGGAGPGEFRMAPFLGLYRDSLWVVDPGELRLTLFPRRGPGVATFPFGYRAPASADGGPRSESGMPAAIQPDGSLIVVENLPASVNPADGPGRTLLLHTGRGLNVLDTIAALPAPHSQMVFVWRDGSTYVNQPFADDPLYTFANDGTRLVIVTRTAPHGPGPQSIQVSLLGTRDGKRLNREIGYQPLPLPESAVDSVVDRFMEDVRRNPGSPITADSLHRRIFRPRYYPPVERVRLCRDGSVWLKVRFADSPLDAADWLVLSPRGFELQRVTAPADFRVLEADRAVLWGTRGLPGEAPELVRLRMGGKS